MENIRFEKLNHIGIVTISRPKALNALNYATLLELDGVIEAIANDNDLYCAVITGAGEKAFVAGADIAEMKDMDVFQAGKFSRFGNRVFRKIELLEIPVIAAINGVALGGGCELALCCDIRIAADHAVFGQPEVSLGITPGFGGTQRLARVAGVGKAKELLFTGAKLKAEAALQFGIVNRITPRENLMEEALTLAEQITGNAPLAVKATKKAVNWGMQCDLDTAVNYEAEVFAQCFASEDQRDAMEAFVAKTRLTGFKNR
jgi:enoyl-CoA hydratase